ncbi:helix-turn-helix domain-containing protein [Altererythrobacter sp. ZODW24]|uniref:winged helix-turn-helix transcriptional regulator n=1 Tax=Altererythrobacter sp. ZODW24 TaxID=2185142 RepID=UPI000DF78EBF|nr:helix-turn-helix domain-containing protein [Altererythrobacter sp. ZODW24]
MKKYTASRAPCPVGRASRLLGDRWVILILREAFLGADRFEQFMDRLPISRAALTSRLAILVEAEVLQRDPAEGRRARYALTAAGDELRPMFTEMWRWGEKHLFEPGEYSPDF